MNCIKRALIVLVLLSVTVMGQEQPTPPAAAVDDLANTLLALKSPQDREQLLTKKKALMTPDLRKALIRHGNAHLLAGQYATAFDIYGLARNISEKIGDKEGIATASLDIGTVYYFQANYPAALEHYQRARELFTELPNQHESAKALSGLALIYKEQRRDTEALAALQQALKEFTALSDNEEIANTLNSIGSILYGQGNYSAAADAFLKSNEANNKTENLVRVADALYMQGDYFQALTYYKQSLAKVSESEIGAYIAALTGAANSAYYQGNYEDALQYYQRSARFQQTQQDKLGFLTALRGIANVHRSRGDYAAALENYFSSLTIAEEIKAPTGTILGSIGLVRALQGDYAKALDYYRKALKEFEASANKIEMARVLSLIGNANYSQTDYDGALASYRQALRLREEMEDQSGQADILSGIGTTLLRQKSYSEALDTYQKALTLFDKAGNKERMADVLTRVSEAFLLQGDYSKALSAAESAAGLARQFDNPDVLWYARMLEGKAQQKLERRPQAHQAFTDAMAMVESLRSRPTSAGNGDHNPVLPFMAALDALIGQNRSAEAFDIAERAKIQALTGLLRNSNALTNKGLSSSEIGQEQRLSGEIASLEFQLERESQSRNRSEARQSQLRERLRQSLTAYSEFRQKLFSTHPRLRVDRGELPRLKLEEIRSLIADTSTALVEYAISETNTYLFVFTADKAAPQAKTRVEINLRLYSLEVSNDELLLRVTNFEQQLASRSDDFQSSARELYDLLIKPAEDQLALKTRLIVVPDGILWRLPFEALESADDHFVADQMQLSYAPSLAALREMRSQATPARPDFSFVAFANPLLSKEFSNRVHLAYSDRSLQSSLKEEELVKRASLPFANKAQLLVGPEATEARFKVEAPRASILHFATPALLDEATPMSSFISMASTSNADDGFLQAREIMNSQTHADLVVLSDTQRTNSRNTGATLGLSWSWFVAGTSSVMLNRWEVDSQAISRQMADLYSGMKPMPARSRIPKGRALYQSAMSLRRSSEYRHPHYWANFAMIGDAR